eukprot:CAMPEP_0173429660 /NCGR_PEP_ID=MMETSP1357-20121228/8307_1 /TAXON_ID=77926 /ORGANISM="Hemiselmis rufescens, Strain PCC563" /LENGTH=97 /DNA_ID=CAMNT_0014393875 /DNA_START=43 /DNA_END=333 /DNA_ORIENTATION=-
MEDVFEALQVQDEVGHEEADAVMNRLVGRETVTQLLQLLRHASPQGDIEDNETRWHRQERAALQVAARCQIPERGKAFKDELMRQGVVERLVDCVCG